MDVIKRYMPDGRRIFNVEHIQGSCQKCLDELEDARQCPHVRMITPAHKSAEKQRMVMELYGDLKDVMARESLGIATSGMSGKFKRRAIESFINAPRIAVEKCSGPIYVAINPNGGLMGYTIVSGCYFGNKLVVVGLDMAQVTNFSEMLVFVRAHLLALRNAFRHCDQRVGIILLPESSLGHEAAQIKAATSNMPGVVCCRETKQGTKWGVPMQDTPALSDHLERLLDPPPLEPGPMAPPEMEHKIVLSEPVISSSASKCVAELEKQLKAWRPMYRTSSDTRKLCYSGRINNEGKIRKHLHDDLCVALQLMAYWSAMVRQHKMANFNYTFS